MFKALLMTRLISLWESIFGRAKKRAGHSKLKIVLFSLLALYVIAAIFFSVGMMFYMIAKPLILGGLGWLVMGLASLMSIALSFIGSIFTAEKQLFEAKDNELLLSMPIPPSQILASRMILILLTNMLFAMFILVPAFIVYSIFAPVLTAAMVIIFIIAFLLLSLFSTAITSACGWLVAIVSSRLRRKNLVSTILALVLFASYMYLNLNVNNLAKSLLENGAQISDALSRTMPLSYLFGTAISQSNIISLLLLALWCLIPFAAIYYLLAKSFLKIATTKRGDIKIKYKEKELKTSSVRVALIQKELGRFFSLPMYILNCSLGAFMALLFAGALVLKKDAILLPLGMTPGYSGSIIALMLCGVLCFMVSMNDITAPSISLEAKTLWILKSLPIRASEVFYAKVAASLIVTIPPVLLSSIIIVFVLKLSAVMGLLFILTPLVLQVFISLFGLAINLKMPRFEWISEIVAIKQSGSVVIAIFGGMAVIAVPALVYVFLLSALQPEIFLLLCLLYFAALAFLIFAFLKKRGEAIFASL
jgi:ABC-2 type transport system permease protein